MKIRINEASPTIDFKNVTTFFTGKNKYNYECYFIKGDIEWVEDTDKLTPIKTDTGYWQLFVNDVIDFTVR